MPAETNTARLPVGGEAAEPTDVASDLATRRSIHDLVVGFYRELVMDELLAPVFEEVAEVDWARHIPLLVDYWCRVMLGHDGYQGALLAAHRHVHHLEPLTTAHFDRWYTLWATTIDERWRGPQADKAKRHAAKIAATLAHRLPAIAWTPPIVDQPRAPSARGSGAHDRLEQGSGQRSTDALAGSCPGNEDRSSGDEPEMSTGASEPAA